ncbi:hypothetical protein D3C75_831660 [compost metagenome]
MIGDLVDILQQRKRLHNRDVPPQLGALAEDGADLGGVLHSFFIRIDTVYRNTARRGHQYSAQHLDRGGLAGTIRPHIGDSLTGFNAQVQRLHRDLGNVPRHKQMLECTF